jgi:hypothetical protein
MGPPGPQGPQGIPGSDAAFPEAPLDGKQYARQSAAWSEVVLPPTGYTKPEADAKFVDVGGDTMTGPLTLNGNPGSPLQAATKQYVDGLVPNLSGYALIASPTFTGDPKAPTPATADNDTSIATTAFVKAQGYVTSSGVTAVSGTAPVVSSGGSTPAISMAVATGSVPGYLSAGDWTTFNGKATTASVALKADIASPTFTGDPKAPTPTAGDNDTSLATTAFVTRDFVAKAGSTMTGDLTIGKATPSLIMDKAAAGQACVLAGKKGGVARWDMHFGNVTAESGSNVGSDLVLNRYSDAGAYIDSPMIIARSSGVVNFTAVPTINFQPFPTIAAISDTAPISPSQGQLWWDSSTGGLFIYYNDGTSSQWVQIGGTNN